MLRTDSFIEEDEKEALNLVNQNLDAEFIIENISPFEDEGFEFIEVKMSLNPYIEEIVESRYLFSNIFKQVSY